MPAHDPDSTDPQQPTDREDAETAGENVADARRDDAAEAAIDEAPVDESLVEPAPVEDEPIEEAPTEVPARVARQARMGRFLGLGAIVGLLLALLLTMLWPDDPDFVPDNPMLEYSDLQVFGFLAVYLVPIFLGLFGLLGYILGRVAEKRSRTEIVMTRVDAADAPGGDPTPLTPGAGAADEPDDDARR